MANQSFQFRHLGKSVISVPPLALTAGFKPDLEENRKIINHLHRGGVTSYLYGGNANFFALPVSGYAAVLEMLEEITPDNAWTIPSIGADYGKALDQVRCDFDFLTTAFGASSAEPEIH